MSARTKSLRSALRSRLLVTTALTGFVLAVTIQPSLTATITVTNTNDSGAGSLRNALTTANPGDTINSTAGLTGTITLGSTLPVANGVAIDLTAGSITIAGTSGVTFNATTTTSLTSGPQNTYTGATAVQTGTLTVGGAAGYSAIQSQLQLSAGTTFNAATTATTTGTKTTAPGATFASLSGSGAINLGGGFGNGLDLTGNDQQSTTFSGSITGAAGEFALFGGGGTLTLTGTSNTYSGPTDIFGSVVVGTPVGTARGATLAAGAANVLSPNSQVVMLGGTSANLVLNNYNQTIGSLAGSGIVQLGSALLTLGGDNTSTTFTGGITGTGGLDKVGTGTFTLTNSGGALQATYSGPTLIDGGVVQAGAANSFSPNSRVSIAPVGRLDLNNFAQTVAGLSGAGSVTLGNATLTVNNAAASTYGGVVSGTGGLAKLGGATLTLSGANTYTGATTVNAGTLAMGAGGSIAASSGLNLATSGTSFDISAGGNQTVKDLTGVAGTSVVLGANTLTAGASNLTTFAGTIGGTGGLTKQGSANLILSGANTYTGATTINGGAIQTGATNTLSPNSAVTVSAGASLTLNGFSQTIAGLSGAGTVFAGQAIGSGGGSGGTLTVNTGATTVFSGTIADSAQGFSNPNVAGLIKSGSGTLTLSGTNSYGSQTVVNGGTLQAGAANAFSPNSPVAVNANGTLDLNGFNQTIAGLVSGGSVTLGAGTLTVNTGTQITVFTGVISGTGGLTMSGGNQFLTGVNTYTGQTTISGGTLALLGNGSIASSSAVNLNSGTLDISSSGNALSSIQNLSSATSTSGGSVNLGSQTLVLSGSLLTIYGGKFTGTGGLIYNGTGGLALTGDNSLFKGPLAILGGQVAIGNDQVQSAVYGGTVTVNGGMLTGFGTLLADAINNALVRPGGSIGTLTIAGNYTQGPNGTLAIEVSPTASSQLKVGGTANLAGTLQLMYDPGIYRTTSYNVLTAAGVTGSFTTVVSNNPSGSGQTLVYGPNGVTEQLAVTTPNGVAVVGANGVTVVPLNDTVFTGVTSQLVMNGQRANAILLDRVGNRAAGIADGQLAALTGGSVAGQQLAQVGGGASVLGGVASALPLASQGAWFRGIGDFGSVGGSGALPGFSGTAGGFLAGYDRPVTDTTYLGLSGGYLHSSVNESGTNSNGRADTARIALYGGALFGPSLVTGTIGYAHDWTGTTRPVSGIGTASGSYGGNEATAAAQWSLPLQLPGYGQGTVTFTPKAGLQYLHLSEDGFTESGASGFSLSPGSRSADSLQPFIAVSASQKFVTSGAMSITPEVRLGYNREALSGSRTLTVGTVSGFSFPVTGVKPAKNIFTAGIGVTVDQGPNLALYATYDGVVPTGNTVEHTVQAGLRIRF